MVIQYRGNGKRSQRETRLEWTFPYLLFIIYTSVDTRPLFYLNAGLDRKRRVIEGKVSIILEFGWLGFVFLIVVPKGASVNAPLSMCPVWRKLRY